MESSTARRRRQAERVAEIVQAAIAEGRKPIVLGDLNIDTRQGNYDGSLDPVFDGALEDPLSAVPEADRWTHFYAFKKSVSRLDYVLTDPSLNAGAPEIFRKGPSTKCKQYAGPALPDDRTPAVTVTV